MSCHSNGALTSCHSNGALISCHSNGALMSCHSNGALMSCHSNGALMSCHSNRVLTSRHCNGTLTSCLLHNHIRTKGSDGYSRNPDRGSNTQVPLDPETNILSSGPATSCLVPWSPLRGQLQQPRKKYR